MQHAENAEMRAVIPPTEDAIHMITKLVNSACIVLFINNILIRKLLYEIDVMFQMHLPTQI
jgi:hypothetical protein